MEIVGNDDVELVQVTPAERCVIITTDQETGERPANNIFKVLGKTRPLPPAIAQSILKAPDKLSALKMTQPITTAMNVKDLATKSPVPDESRSHAILFRSEHQAT